VPKRVHEPLPARFDSMRLTSLTTRFPGTDHHCRASSWGGVGPETTKFIEPGRTVSAGHGSEPKAPGKTVPPRRCWIKKAGADGESPAGIAAPQLRHWIACQVEARRGEVTSSRNDLTLSQRPAIKLAPTSSAGEYATVASELGFPALAGGSFHSIGVTPGRRIPTRMQSTGAGRPPVLRAPNLTRMNAE